jgi:hypothetical protein
MLMTGVRLLENRRQLQPKSLMQRKKTPDTVSRHAGRSAPGTWLPLVYLASGAGSIFLK